MSVERSFPLRLPRARADEKLLLACFHLVPVVVAEQVQEAVRQRPPPLVAHHLRAENDVAEDARHTLVNDLAAVDREREHIGGLVDPEVIALQLAHLVRTDERDPELAVLDPLGPQHAPRELDGPGLVDLRPASVLDVDGDHRFRSSVCSLYASTMRCTSLCRTTSLCPNSTNWMPSMSVSTSRTWTRPDRFSRGRSICVTSPVTTTFEPNPSRVRNICICSGEVFWASSRMMKLSFSVRPRMNASGATSIVPRSIRLFALSGSSMSYSASKSGRRYGSTFAIRSPGRNPSRSPASTAGRVRMMRATSRSCSAATASAIAR